MTVPDTSSRVNALLARLAERRPKKIDLSLGRITRALYLLGNPHLKLPPVFHIAGTNGKGSVVAYTRTILEEAGLRVHSYISPHLVRFNERITLAGEEISDDHLIEVLGRCDMAAGEEPLTYFEAVTCAAFLAFAEIKADALVLEVGLGGRLDATNVIDRPIASIITPIGLDHQSYLGDKIEQIAGEKAGIIKSGAPCIIGAQNNTALSVLENRALAMGAPTHIFGQDWTVRLEQGRLLYEDDIGLTDVSPPRLFGSHQIENAGLAIAGLKASGMAPNDDVISRGLEKTFWPARLQRLRHGPLIDRAEEIAGAGIELWLDGGHNPHAARVIARAMADLEERNPKPLILISGLQSNKDAEGYFAAFVDIASTVYTVNAQLESASPSEMVAAAAQRAGLPAIATSSVAQALQQALGSAANSMDGAPRILICGSLYLAGEILENHK